MYHYGIMNNKQDLQKREDIVLLVHTFYSRIRKDVLLGTIFNTLIIDWDDHLELLTDFWETNLFFCKKIYRESIIETYSS